MKNIAIIITKLNGGGAERCASNLSVELSKRYNVYLIVFDTNNITYPHGGTLIDLNIPKANNAISRYLGVVKRAFRLRKLKKELSIDVAISLLEGPNLVNALSKYKEKTIVSVRNYMSKQPNGFIANKIIQYASKHSDITVSLSKMVGKDLIDNYKTDPNKIVTIYNHVDRELLENQTSSNNLTLDPSKKYIVTMGRMHPQKGHWHLIRAFKKIADKCPDVNLLILGDGPLRESLTQLVNNLNLQDRVIMPGFVEAPHKYFKYCEMFVLSSLYEGLGNVILEAQAFGLPVISTDCFSGPREILAPNTDLTHTTSNIEYGEYGILVPVDENTDIASNSELTDNENKLAEAILRLHNDDKLLEHYRNRSIENSMKFNKAKIIADWTSLLD